VERVPARILPDGVAEPDVAAEGVHRVVGEDPPRVVDIEARREGLVEEPGLGEADGAVLYSIAAADAEEDLPALAEEVALGEVEGAEHAVLRAVAAANREDPGGLLGHVDVDDDLVLRGAGRGLGLDLVEVVQVGQSLLGSGELLAGEEIALRHRDFA